MMPIWDLLGAGYFDTRNIEGHEWHKEATGSRAPVVPFGVGFKLLIVYNACLLSWAWKDYRLATAGRRLNVDGWRTRQP